MDSSLRRAAVALATVTAPVSLHDAETAPGRERQATLPFLGRLEELGMMRAALAAAVGGHGAVILISGEPGIGKTELVGQLAMDPSCRGVRVTWGRCWDGKGAPAFWPWIQVLRTIHDDGRRAADGVALEIGAALERVGRPLPDPTSIGPEARFRLFDQILTRIRDAAKAQPVLMVLDDLHWADQASISLIQFIAPELPTIPLLLVGTYRDVESSAAAGLTQVLAAVSRHRWTYRIPLSGLSTEEIRLFIEEAVGTAPSAQSVRALAQRTGGNPYFLTEIVRGLQLEANLRTDFDAHALRALPDTIREAVDRRIHALPAGAADVLRYASVVGAEFSVPLVALLAPNPDRIRQALEVCVHAKLIVPTGTHDTGEFRFAHVIARDVLYESLPVQLREHWHATLATALEPRTEPAGDVPLAMLAYHFAMAGAAGDPVKAYQYSLRAGARAAAAYAYEDAVAHYERAVAYARPPSVGAAERCDALLALGDAQRQSGFWQQCRVSFRAAAAIARGNNPAMLAGAAIGMSGSIGQFPVDEEAVGLLRDALSAIGSSEPAIRVRLLAALTFSLHFDSDPMTRASLSAEALALAAEIGSPSLRAEALECRMNALVGRSDPNEMQASASEAIDLAVASGDAGREFRCRIFRHLALLQVGAIPFAEREFRRCAALARGLRNPKYVWQIAVIDAGRALVRGDFARAERHIAHAATTGYHVDDALAEQYRIIQHTCLLHARGDVGAAAAGLRTVAQLYPDFASAHAGLANAYVAAGAHRAAREALEWFTAAELKGESGFFRSLNLALTAEAAALAGDDARAEILYQLLRPHAGEFIVVSWAAAQLGSVAHYLGLLAASLGLHDDAARYFEAALTANARLHAPALLAATQRRYAEMLLDRGRPADEALAADLLQRARVTYAALGCGEPTASYAAPAKRAAASICPSGDRRGMAITPAAGSASGPAALAGSYVFRREGDYWTVAFEGRVRRLRHRKGMVMLLRLLERPDTDVHVLDLIAATEHPTSPREPEHVAEAGAMPRRETTAADPALDHRARDEYRRRIGELRNELLDAERCNDLGRQSAIRLQLEQLESELRRAYGYFGHDRPSGADSERARINVRNNISAALANVRQHDERLWRHLRAAVRTGTICSYRPERDILWEF